MFIVQVFTWSWCVVCCSSLFLLFVVQNFVLFIFFLFRVCLCFLFKFAMLFDFDLIVNWLCCNCCFCCALLYNLVIMLLDFDLTSISLICFLLSWLRIWWWSLLFFFSVLEWETWSSVMWAKEWIMYLVYCTTVGFQIVFIVMDIVLCSSKIKSFMFGYCRFMGIIRSETHI